MIVIFGSIKLTSFEVEIVIVTIVKKIDNIYGCGFFHLFFFGGDIFVL